MAITPNLTLAIASNPPCSRISSIQHLPSQFTHPLKCSLPDFPVSLPYTAAASDNALSAIQDSGVIACLRANSAELAIEAARAALDGGVTVLEIVISNPGAFEILEQLVQDYPTKTLGVGTVLNAEDAKNAIKFGVKFLLSPAMVKGILDNASCCKALYIPGAMTPTEILSAFNTGAKMIKVYPVSSTGGVQYIKALKRPFPHIPLIASQGITLDSVDEYIARGAAAVVLSDAIFNKKAMLEKNFETIYQLSRSAALCAIKAIERTRR